MKQLLGYLPKRMVTRNNWQRLCLTWRLAQRRADLILELQAGIMDDYNAACIGRDMTVLCEHRARSGMCSGRTYADSPEIDGTVYFTGAAQPGDMVTVHITGCDDGDLAGEQIHE